jgi:hypothetical protein
VPYPGLLQPLPIPDMVWQHVTMNFIEALPKSEGKDTILVVVDKLIKYAHFIPMCHPFTTRTIVQLFIDTVFKLHGLPLAIITDRDRIFTSQLWQDIFKSLAVKLKFSGAYHPRLIDSLNELINASNFYSGVWCSNIPRSGIPTSLLLNGGTIPLFILH